MTTVTIVIFLVASPNLNPVLCTGCWEHVAVPETCWAARGGFESGGYPSHHTGLGLSQVGTRSPLHITIQGLHPTPPITLTSPAVHFRRFSMRTTLWDRLSEGRQLGLGLGSGEGCISSSRATVHQHTMGAHKSHH